MRRSAHALVFALVTAVLLAPASPASAVLPELPRVLVDTTYVAPTGVTIAVAAGGNLQTALNNAQPGDVITLAAGATFQGPFVLPNKAGTGWIIVRTSAPDTSLPAPGTRVTPAHAAVMPKITVGGGVGGAIQVNAGAHHFRFIGIEFKPVAGATVWGLLELGTGGETSDPAFPHHIIVDRCYLHGNAGEESIRGIAMNGKHIGVVDSYFAGFKSDFYDTQAVMGWNGPGPFKIVNNYLESAGENVMFGGSDPSIVNVVPSDIEVRGNYFFKPLTFRGTWDAVKNLFELKNARRVLVEGNVMENVWLAAQSGYAVQFTVRNQDGGAPWSTIEDVTFRKNIIRHAGSGVNILGTDDPNQSQTMVRVLIEHNVFEDVNSATWGGLGKLFQILDYRVGTSDMTIQHNTGFQDGALLYAEGVNHTRFAYRNNLAPRGAYGISGAGVPEGVNALTTYFPLADVHRNVIAGASASLYPADNYFPASLNAIGFVNLAGGNYRLGATSPYRNAATDGTDVGADIDAVAAATAGAITGVMGSTDTTPPSITVTAPGTGATVSGTAVTVTATATDDTGVASVQFRLDGAALGAPVTTPPYSITWDTTTASNGAHTLSAQAQDAAGNTAISTGVPVTVSNPNPVPVFTSLSPTGTTVGSAGFTLTVNGSNLVPGSKVRWDGADRTTTFVNATRLTASIPAADVATLGTASITVFSPAPGGGTSVARTFTISAPAPTFTSMSPASATAGGAAFTLTVNGTGFVAASEVRWNGAARPTTLVSATQLTAAISAADVAAQGTASVTVFSPAPGGGTSVARTFTINAPAPTFSGMSPANTVAGSAAFTLTVNGTGFVPSSEVRWNGTTRATTLVSATQLTAAIAAADVAAQGTASVTVFSPTPGGGTSAAQTFTVNAPAPTLSSLSPTSLAAGSAAFTLTVNGTGFVASSEVRWNGTARATTLVSATQLTAAIAAADVATGGTAQVTVATPAPGGGVSAAQTFTIVAGNPLPGLTALTPGAALAGSSAFTLTLDGTGFVASSEVRWNGAARPTTFVSATQLSAAIPAADVAAQGTASVTVFSPAPGGGTSAAQTFTINAPAPTLSGVSPTSATAGGAGFTLTVNGTGFVASSVVRWSGVTRPTTLVSATQLTAAIAAADVAAPGTASVTVFSPTPGGGTSAAQTLTINAPAPALSSVSPTSVTAGATAFTLTLNGTGFVTSSEVRWNGVARPTTFVSATQLTGAIAAADVAAQGTASVTVFSPTPGGGTSTTRTFTINAPAPTVSGLSPSSVTVGSAAFTLTVNGAGFVAGSEVRWNGAARTTTFVSATQLTAAIAAADVASAGTAAVTVVTPAPGGGTSGAQTFTTSNPAPTLSGLSPSSVTAGSAAFTLTVDGTGFVAGSQVRWKGAARTTTVVSSTQVTAAITAADVATAGTAAVTVMTPVPGGGTSAAQTFTTNNPAPTLSGLSPSSVTAGGAAFTLTVNGTGFVAGSQVRWNGVARTTTFVSATQLTAAITAADIATAGTPSVTVVTPAPGGGTSSAQTFTANNPLPTLSSLSPTGATMGGAAFTLTVNGAGFVAGSQVQWDAAARPTTFVSATRLTAAIPAADIATIGTASITVVTPAPGGGTSGAQTFTTAVADNPVPTLTGLSPSGAVAGSGDFTLTVTGSSFVGASQAHWNGAARPTTVVSATQLTAAIAAADVATAGTAQVAVVTPAPGGGTSTAQTFTIGPANPAPEVLALSPSNTTAGGAGLTLSVTGNRFMASSRVHWNGTPRTTTFTNATRLTAVIAAGDLAAPGAAVITVVTPAPGGGTSGTQTFRTMPMKRLLTVGKQGTGAGHVTSTAPALDCAAMCAVGVDSGATVTLTATASAGSVFIGWSGACAGTASTCTVVMDAPRTATAEFTLLSVVGFSAATYSVGEAGPVATITVTRSGGTHAGVSVSVGTADGTAIAGVDYAAVASTVIFGAGQTSQSVTVPVVNGTLADGNKTLTLGLGNLQGLAVFGPRTAAQLTVVDNDVAGTVQFSAARYTIAERADAPTVALIRVTRSGGAASGVTVNVISSDGTATAGADYTPVAQTLTFGAGETFKDVPVTILPDVLVEGNETLWLRLANPAGGARLGALTTAELTILDAQVGLQFSAPVYRALESNGTVTVTVVRTGPITGTATVEYSTSDGNAVALTDYVAVSGVLTFLPGAMSRTFTVPLRDDTVVDGVKTILLRLGAAVGGGLGPQSTAVIIVNDSDGGGALRFSAPTFSVTEGAGAATITVVRSGGVASAVTVDYATSDGTAAAGVDYQATAGTLTFNAGQTSATFTVPIVPDALVEGAETVALVLSRPTGGATLGAPATAELRIGNDDVGGTLRFGAATYSVVEGGAAMLTVMRTGGVAGNVTVTYTTADETAAGGVHYTTTSGTLTFAAGETARTLTVQTAPPSGVGRNRTFTVALGGPGGGGVLGAPAVARVAIVAATASVEFSAATYTVNEGRGSITATVLRSGSTTGTVVVNYATGDSTAIAGEDYTAAAGVLTFGPGVTARTITVAIRADAVVEGDETFFLMLGTPTGASLGAQSTAQVVIVDDDGPGTLQFSAAAYRAVEGSAATITVVRTGGVGGTVTVPYTASAGTATAGVDFTAVAGVLTFGPGITSRTFTVPTLADTVVEGDETVALTLEAPAGGATLGTLSTAVLTIAENDAGGTLRFSLAEYTIAEGGLATIAVTRTGGTASGVTVNYATAAGGSAVANIDFVPAAGALTFAAGQTLLTFTVQTLPDTLAQGDRTVRLELSGAGGGGTLGTPVASTLTIVDDEPRVRLTAAAYTVAEGGMATVTVLRSGASTGTVTVGYAMSYQTAAAADLDAPVGGTLTFGPGVTSRTFTVLTHQDTQGEGTETLSLSLTGPVGATLGTPAVATLSIMDNETAGTVEWSEAAYSASERAGGVMATITRTGGTASDVTVAYAAAAGTAVAGADYVATAGTVTFGVGETTKTVWVPVVADGTAEPTETFSLRLSDPTGGAALGPQATTTVYVVD